MVRANVSTLSLQSMPKKCKDPGMFVFPYMIGEKKIEYDMLGYP